MNNELLVKMLSEKLNKEMKNISKIIEKSIDNKNNKCYNNYRVKEREVFNYEDYR